MSQTPKPTRKLPSQATKRIDRWFIIGGLVALLAMLFLGGYAFVRSTTSTVVSKATATQMPTQSPTPTATSKPTCPALQTVSASYNYGKIAVEYYRGNCGQLLVHFHYKHGNDAEHDYYWWVKAEYSKVPLSIRIGNTDSWTAWIMVSKRGLEQQLSGRYIQNLNRYDPITQQPVPADPSKDLQPAGWEPTVADPLRDWFAVGRFLLVIVLAAYVFFPFWWPRVWKKAQGQPRKMHWFIRLLLAIVACFICWSLQSWVGDWGYYIQHMSAVIPIHTPNQIDHP